MKASVKMAAGVAAGVAVGLGVLTLAPLTATILAGVSGVVLGSKMTSFTNKEKMKIEEHFRAEQIEQNKMRQMQMENHAHTEARTLV